ncbi:MAG: chemotaxis protein CheA [Spirochaetes bacterium]|nr:chemotaxis protein CheA [Spirochaetota bacterium]
MDASRFADTYREEAAELLEKIEQSLVALEQTPENSEIVNDIFRAMHTIKGSGAMFGFTRVSAFAHECETMFDLIRKGTLAVSRDIIDVTLAARDHIKTLLADEPGVPEAATAHLVGRIVKFLPVRAGTVVAPDKKPVPEKQWTYRIIFKPSEDIFKRGVKLTPLFNEIHAAGRAVIVADPHTPPLDEFDPEVCCTTWNIVLTTVKDVHGVRDIFIFVEDGSELSIELIDEEGSFVEGDYKRIGDILLERGSITREELAALISSHKRIGEQAVEKGIVAPHDVEAAVAEQRHVREVREEQRQQTARATIRVQSEKLDHLMNLVGELVTLEAQFMQTAVTRDDLDLISMAQSFERLIGDLRDTSMVMRMVPVDELFKSFVRPVRDLAHELGKEIDLVTVGKETELDKTVIESLKDPLMHILRNALDHGIESPGVRVKAGKPAKGTVTLSARHEGAHVVIAVSDDGAGLNRQRILAKAVERGLVAEGAELSGREIQELIFLPGFSTAEKATSVSGRGVGMDVVKKNVERLRGTIAIESSPEGTKMLLRIPLTLAIVDGLLARIGGSQFILNLSNADECVDLTADVLGVDTGSDVVNLRGEMVPFIRLRNLFAIDSERVAVERMIITQYEDRRIGLVVDDVLGKQQTVIKSIGRTFRDVDEVSGATILGDGTIALILDVNIIIKNHIRNTQAAGGASESAFRRQEFSGGTYNAL